MKFMRFLFVQLALGLNAFITCQGFAKTSMLTVLIGAVLNTVLDPLFMFALNMGVQGAALATLISQAVSAIWVVCFLTGKKTILKLRPVNLRLNWKRWVLRPLSCRARRASLLCASIPLCAPTAATWLWAQ